MKVPTVAIGAVLIAAWVGAGYLYLHRPAAGPEIAPPRVPPTPVHPTLPAAPPARPQARFEPPAGQSARPAPVDAYPDAAALLAQMDAAGETAAVMIDGVIVRPGFGPPLCYVTHPSAGWLLRGACPRINPPSRRTP